jgi:plastocyanin
MAGMRALLALPLLLVASPALSSGLTVEIRTRTGSPVANAVVTLYPGGRPAPLPAARPAFQIAQRDLTFSPFVLVVPVGSQVSFPNFDNVRHHVYSFSPVRRFELRLYARQQSRSVLFDRAGIVPIGCNIHDGMIAFIHVADTGLAVRTDGLGRAMFADVPPGALVARVWHPYLRAPANRVEQRWTAPRAGRLAQAVTVDLRPPPRPGRAY